MNEYKIVLYEAINAINGKRYIGITQCGIKLRKKRHIWTANAGHGSVIGAAIRKYGENSFKFKVLVVCPSFDYAKLIEIATILKFGPEYNVTSGGDGASGFRHTEEHKLWMSKRHKGKKFTLGKTLTKEHKESIRQSRLAGKGGPKKGQKYKLRKSDRVVQVNCLTEG